MTNGVINSRIIALILSKQMPVQDQFEIRLLDVGLI